MITFSAVWYNTKNCGSHSLSTKERGLIVMKRIAALFVSALLLISTLFCSGPAAHADGFVQNRMIVDNNGGYINALSISPYFGSLNDCSHIPFYYATATSELREGNILFSAAYAIDETVSRPWVEGVRGNGSGESLTVWFSRAETIDVLSLRLGYARSADLYYYNSRPKTVRFEFSDGSWADYVFGDRNQEQIIRLSRSVETTYVKMTILDVYAGDCSDTCIYLVKAYRLGQTGSLRLSPFNDYRNTYYQVPFYSATASSELREGDTIFSAFYAIDETVSRPWVEGVRGSGSGESLTLWFNGTKDVDVLSLRLGYARSAELYYYNNRPRTIRFEFSDGRQADYVFGDINQEQIIQLSETVRTNYVKLTILDVYPGDCSDTCIYLVKAYCA